ncbi:unnamed protein product, partial [Iphiclides podalirius]
MNCVEVRSAQAAVDARAPAERPHVALKLKKLQRELERAAKVQRDNFSLLQRLGAVMALNRLDNHWQEPLPNFQRKVGQFYDVKSLNSKLTARSSQDNFTGSAHGNFKCYACEHRRNKEQLSERTKKRFGTEESSCDVLPLIYYKMR